VALYCADELHGSLLRPQACGPGPARCSRRRLVGALSEAGRPCSGAAYWRWSTPSVGTASPEIRPALSGGLAFSCSWNRLQLLLGRDAGACKLLVERGSQSACRPDAACDFFTAPAVRRGRSTLATGQATRSLAICCCRSPLVPARRFQDRASFSPLKDQAKNRLCKKLQAGWSRSCSAGGKGWATDSIPGLPKLLDKLQACGPPLCPGRPALLDCRCASGVSGPPALSALDSGVSHHVGGCPDRCFGAG